MELKINESKVLEFNTVIEGGNADDLSAKLRLTIDEMEYGFPVNIDGKKIQVKIPPLKDYIKEGKLKSKNANARLDIIAKGKIFTPWKENIEIEIPLEVKAEMTDMKGFLEEADNFIKVSKVKDEAVKASKTKDQGKETNENVKFDAEKMKKLIAKDLFLKKQKGDLKVIFNTYVLGDSAMEKKYMSEGIKKGSAKKSKFSIMLEEKCPEGQKY
jgi:hypothetical protein